MDNETAVAEAIDPTPPPAAKPKRVRKPAVKKAAKTPAKKAKAKAPAKKAKAKGGTALDGYKGMHRAGSRKGKVHEAYDKGGRPAALKRAEALGISVSTARTWVQLFKNA